MSLTKASAAVASRSLASLFTGILGGRVASAGAQALTFALLARALSQREFVVVGAVLGALVFVAAVTDMGAGAAATRAAAQRNNERLRSLSRLNLFTAAGAGVVSAAGLTLMVVASNGRFSPWFVGLGMWLWLERLAEFNLSTLIGEARSLAVATSIAVRRITPLLPVAWTTVQDSEDMVIPALVIGYVIGTFPFAVVGRWRAPRGVKMNEFRSIRSGVSEAVPFWINSIAAQSRQLDILIVSGMGTQSAAAAYAPVSRLIAPLRMLPTTFAQAILSIASSAPPSDKMSRWRLSVVVGVSAVIIFAPVAIYADEMMVAVFGNQYADSGGTLRGVTLGLVFAAVSSVQTSVLQASGRERVVAGVNASIAVVSLLGIAFGAALKGSEGAAIGLAMGFILQAAALSAVPSPKAR
jgi:O-antigen/teichoic acid export membrane protein